jgi:hypothetical protein
MTSIFVCNSCIGNLTSRGEYMRNDYRIELHDGFELSFSYSTKDEIKKMGLVKKWKNEIDLQSKFIPQVYSYEGRYFAYFPENSARSDYGIICDTHILFEKLKTNEIVIFNPDNNFKELHFFELLRENHVNDILEKYDLENIELKCFSNEHTKYFKFTDGRILAVLLGGEGELFINEEEVCKLRKMEAGTF